MNISAPWYLAVKRATIAYLGSGMIFTSPLQAADAPHAASTAGRDEIVVYSARNEQLIKPMFDAYTCGFACKKCLG